MSSHTKVRLASLSVIAALLLSAVLVTPAFADEGAPPADPAVPAEEGGDVSDPADGLPQPSDAVQPTAEPAPADAAELAGEPAATEVAPTDAADAPGEGAVAAVLSELPDGTTVAVVNEAGEPLPLASEEAAEVVATGDPIWCPASVSTPVDGLSGCTASYESLKLLLDYLKANEPTVDGVIWIEKTYDSGSQPVDQLETMFQINGVTETTWANYKLTIKGGWNGLGTNTIDVADPSEINARLLILNWQNDVTISDILVTNASGDPVLEITTTGKITATRLRVEANADSGAYLDNTLDAIPSDILITLSRFIDNPGGDGLDVYSNGTVTLSGVIASGNGGGGVYVSNTAAPTAKNVVMASGAFEFNGNGGHGLRVSSKGTITLKDITATGNSGGTGVYLDNLAGTAAGVTLTGVNVFCENGTGLYVQSRGAISANTLVANANLNQGVHLDNAFAATAQPVKLTGSNQFKFNGYGLEINSNGAVTLSSVTASHNDSGAGAVIYNDSPGFSGGVTLTGTNAFNENYSAGLIISSYGAIAASNVTANWNGIAGGSGIGASLNNAGAASAESVKLSGTNQFNGNLDGGLNVYSKGAVTLSNVTASDNVDELATAGGTGIYIDNTSAPAASPQNVTLSGVNAANGNFHYGVSISSYGVISVANLTASYNGLAGPGNFGAYLYNAGGTLARAVTFSGTNTFDDNRWTGLSVTSRGAITVNNVFARGNDAYGVYLYNAYDGVASAVAVNGTSEFAGNDVIGLYALSRGNITLQNFDAYENQDAGVVLANDSGTSTGSVTVGTSKSGWCNGLWDNWSTGMSLSSYGSVTLSNLCAWSNGDEAAGGNGVRVWNVGAASAKAVTLKGTNSFDDNYNAGLYIYTRGPVTANSLSAVGNRHGDGVYITTTYSGAAAPQNVTLTGTGYFAGNYYNGLTVSAYGAITGSNLTAVENGLVGGGYGAYLDNYIGGNATLVRNVTLSGTNAFSGNGATGLMVLSLGAISASNVSAEDNLGGGADLENAYGTATAASLGVTLSGTSNLFSGNSSFGLWAISYGPISAAGLQAEDNVAWFGVRLWNDGASTPKPVTLSGSSNRFTGNPSSGLEIRSKGVVTIANLHASGNDSYGALVDNTYSGAAAPQNVTISGVNSLFDNWHDGLYVYSYGAIALSNVTAGYNGRSLTSGSGVVLNNNPSGAGTIAKGITLTGYGTFNENYQYGLYAVSLGAIKANSLTATLNGDAGVYLDNQWGAFTSAVTLTGTNVFEDNDSHGLVVFSNGAISLSNVTANWNEDNGAYLQTSWLLAPQNVTLTGTNVFNGNGDSVGHTGNGLEVLTGGQITISSLTANWNADTGAILDNLSYYLTGTPGLTLSGVNTFLGNYSTGLDFNVGYGAVSLSKITADDNGGSGVDGATDGNITISCGSMTDNGGFGWHLWTPSVVTLKGVFAYGNGTNTFLGGGGMLVVYRACL